MPIFKVLVVEDEIKLINHLTKILNENHFITSSCSTYDNLLEIIHDDKFRYDVIILDRLLHGKDSAGLIKKIKDLVPETRIIVLSAISTAAEKTLLLDFGADDYLSKPFDGDELIARIRALLRRNSNYLTVGNLILHLENRTIRVEQQERLLTNKEFLLLKTLVQIPGKIFHKDLLHEKVWEINKDVESNVVETTANKLRHRLKDLGASLQIKNLRNVGYWVEE